jgi:hypothetical protein
MLARIIAFLLKRDLSVKTRTILLNAVIHSFGFPIKAIISTDENRRILVQGKLLTVDETVQLQESAYALARNPALRLIRDQVRFKAIELGYLQNVDADPYRELFYKAALWYAQEEKELIDGLAGSPDSTR